MIVLINIALTKKEATQLIILRKQARYIKYQINGIRLVMRMKERVILVI
jgi:hypothetical protein